jgi:hypothetical protein
MSTFYLTPGERPMVYFVSSGRKRKERRMLRTRAKLLEGVGATVKAAELRRRARNG